MEVYCTLKAELLTCSMEKGEADSLNISREYYRKFFKSIKEVNTQLKCLLQEGCTKSIKYHIKNAAVDNNNNPIK